MQSSSTTETHTICVTTEYHKNNRGLTREVVRAVEVNGTRIYECSSVVFDYSVLPKPISDFMEWCKQLSRRLEKRKDSCDVGN